MSQLNAKYFSHVKPVKENTGAIGADRLLNIINGSSHTNASGAASTVAPVNAPRVNKFLGDKAKNVTGPRSLGGYARLAKSAFGKSFKGGTSATPFNSAFTGRVWMGAAAGAIGSMTYSAAGMGVGREYSEGNGVIKSAARGAMLGATFGAMGVMGKTISNSPQLRKAGYGSVGAAGRMTRSWADSSVMSGMMYGYIGLTSGQSSFTSAVNKVNKSGNY
jgi:hypothetical protein